MIETARIGNEVRVKHASMAPAIVRRATVAFALALVLPGCRHFEQLSDCRALADAVNPVLLRIDEARKQDPEGEGTYRKIAHDYDGLSAVLVGLQTKSKRVAEAAADYQRLTHEAGRDARQFADALAAKDMTKQLSARSTATRTLKHEGATLARLESVCRVGR